MGAAGLRLRHRHARHLAVPWRWALPACSPADCSRSLPPVQLASARGEGAALTPTLPRTSASGKRLQDRKPFPPCRPMPGALPHEVLRASKWVARHCDGWRCRHPLPPRHFCLSGEPRLIRGPKGKERRAHAPTQTPGRVIIEGNDLKELSASRTTARFASVTPAGSRGPRWSTGGPPTR